MLVFLTGRYFRRKALPPTTDRCPRCQHVAQIHWRRTYETLHFFCFPLFSVGDTVTATCGVCGYWVYAPHPFVRDSTPFFDRFGWTIPAFLGVMCFGGAIWERERADAGPPTAEKAERLRLEEHLDRGKAWGEGPGAQALADDLTAEMVGDEGFDRRDIGIVVKVSDDHRVFVDCVYSAIDSLPLEARRHLVSSVRRLLVPKLESDTHFVVAIKNLNGAYAILARGSADHWQVALDYPMTKDVEAAMREPVPANAVSSAAVSSATITSAELPAPATAESAAPAASVRLPPPKKKKKPKLNE